MLRAYRTARVHLPNNDDILQYKYLFYAKHSMLHDVYCIEEGLKVGLEESCNTEIQNMSYNVWTHRIFVGSMFTFTRIRNFMACALCASGVFPHSEIAECGGSNSKIE